MAETKIEFTGRSYKNYNVDHFQKSLNELKWDDYFEIEDPNECWDILFSRIINILDDMCPEQVFKVNSYREDEMNNGIMEIIIDKNKIVKIGQQILIYSQIGKLLEN